MKKTWKKVEKKGGKMLLANPQSSVGKNGFWGQIKSLIRMCLD